MSRRLSIALACIAALCIVALLLPQDRTRPRVPPPAPPSEGLPTVPETAAPRTGLHPASPPTPVSAQPEVTGSSSESSGFQPGLPLPPPGEARIAAARALPAVLTLPEIQAIHTYLRSPLPPERFHAGEFVVRNDLMARLVEQDHHLDEVATQLCSLCLDPAQNPVMRAYAVQHVFLLYENPAAIGLRPAMRDTLFAALADSSNATAGTALLALDRLLPLDPSIPAEDVKAAAVRLALAPETASDSRSAACEVAARHNAAEALPALRDAARSGPILSLRLAAIAALGRSGDETDIPLLNTLAADPALRPAVAVALQNHQSRQSSSTRQESP